MDFGHTKISYTIFWVNPYYWVLPYLMITEEQNILTVNVTCSTFLISPGVPVLVLHKISKVLVCALLK